MGVWAVLILWILLVADSIGALFLKSSGALECWYTNTFPTLAGLFPIQNGWPFMYFALAALGLLTAMYALSKSERTKSVIWRGPS